MKKILVLLAFSTSTLFTFAQRHYGGGHHTSSHGGHYAGSSSGSSHKGGHYRNTNTSNHYGRHK